MPQLRLIGYSEMWNFPVTLRLVALTCISNGAHEIFTLNFGAFLPAPKASPPR